MNALRILHYMPGSRLPGGMASYLSRLVEAQRADGDVVEVADDGPHRAEGVLRIEPGMIWSEAERWNADVVHLHVAIDPDIEPTRPAVRTMHGHWMYCPSGSRFLKRSMMPCPRAYSLVGCAAAHLLDRCGSIRPAELLASFSRRKREARQPKPIRVLAISEFVLGQMRRSGYTGPGEVIYLPAPSWPDPLPRPRSRRILMAARMGLDKGPTWLIRAMARLPAEVSADLVGEGPALPVCRALVAELSLADRVRFHGWQDEAAVRALMAEAELVVFPSIWHEPAGLVTLEAAAAGRPVIASRVGGIPEYVQRCGNGVLVEPNDDAGLAEAIQRLLDDRALADRLGETGRAASMAAASMATHAVGVRRAYAAVVSESSA